MKKILVGLMLITAMLLTACKEPTNEEIFYQMQKSLNNMASYTCTAHITITGNKKPEYHVAKHVFKKPNKYIIEILEPEGTKGKITIFDGDQAWLYHPQIDQTNIIRNFKDSLDETMFIGYFLRIFLTTEKSQIKSESIDGNEYLVLTAQIPGNNRYRAKEKLWISKKNFIPYQLMIYDKDGKETVRVKYTDFKYDEKINDDKFNIEVYRSSSREEDKKGL